MKLMQGERGEWIREAAQAEKREENVIMMKVLWSIMWLVQLMSILVDSILSVFSKDYKPGIYERTMPSIFKENYGTDGAIIRGKTIKELHNSKVLKDKKLWD